MTKSAPVHTHGPTEGPGLHCAEHLVGHCRMMRVTHYRINGPDGPSYAIAEDHPEAESWSRRVAAGRSDSFVERRVVTTYFAHTSDWEAAE